MQHFLLDLRVVYFDPLWDVRSTQKLGIILFWPFTDFFLLFDCFYHFPSFSWKEEKLFKKNVLVTPQSWLTLKPWLTGLEGVPNFSVCLLFFELFWKHYLPTIGPIWKTIRGRTNNTPHANGRTNNTPHANGMQDSVHGEYCWNGKGVT